MTDYLNPIDRSNPFLTTPPIVVAVRHVRITVANEVVVEDGNALPRHLMRVDAHRVYPRQQMVGPPQRNVPDNGERKKAF